MFERERRLVWSGVCHLNCEFRKLATSRMRFFFRNKNLWFHIVFARWAVISCGLDQKMPRHLKFILSTCRIYFIFNFSVPRARTKVQEERKKTKHFQTHTIPYKYKLRALSTDSSLSSLALHVTINILFKLLDRGNYLHIKAIHLCAHIAIIYWNGFDFRFVAYLSGFRCADSIRFVNFFFCRLFRISSLADAIFCMQTCSTTQRCRDEVNMRYSY